MPDAKGRYARDERDDVKTPTCEICGARTVQEWKDVGEADEPVGAWWETTTLRCAAESKHPS